MLLRDNTKHRKILFDSDDYIFYAPKLLFSEIFTHKEKIVQSSKLSEDEILSFLQKIMSRITFIGDDLISNENINQAYNLCKNIDLNDTIFVALTLELDGLLWTGDKKLKNGLKNKGFKSFF